MIVQEKTKQETSSDVSTNEHCIKNTIYSVGVDQTPNLRERIAEAHGPESEVMTAVDELDDYVSSPETRKDPWYWSFLRRVKSGMSALYPHAADYVRTSMAREFMDELFHGGYIRALQSLAVPSGPAHARFARNYADEYGVSIGAALLFGPRGAAHEELVHFLAAEKVHGMHRNGASPHPRWSKETTNIWYKAERIQNWPKHRNRKGKDVPLDVIEEQGTLPDGMVDPIRDIWRRQPALRSYVGTNRLSGDLPYQIIEDVLDVLVRRRFSPLDEFQKARYSQIVERANAQGVDSFYAVYQNLFANKDRWRPLWNKARKLLHDYSMLLWESQNELLLSQGKRVPACGVVYRPAKTTACKSKKKSLPGTIYLNRGGYYWVVARKMKPRPLIDPKSKSKVPGSFIVNNGRYYWHIPGWVKRQRLVQKGEKYSTKDKAVALRIAKKLWAEIQKDDPELAANVRKHTRINGKATKDRVVAERVAARMWRDIKKNDTELATKLSTDLRPKAVDHWYAYIAVNRKKRFIGSFENRQEAEAAYAREFEKAHGYPPGYNVQCIPKIDKVWPTWSEEKVRLALMNEQPRLPVIGQSSESEPLKPLVGECKGLIGWLKIASWFLMTIHLLHHRILLLSHEVKNGMPRSKSKANVRSSRVVHRSIPIQAVSGLQFIDRALVKARCSPKKFITSCLRLSNMQARRLLRRLKNGMLIG